MSTHFLVAQQDHAWQFSVRGEITGPFDSKEKAVEQAIAAAKASDIPDAEVLVRDADMKSETVWVSDRNV